MKIFKGLDRAYGVYSLTRQTIENDKVIGKPTTVHKNVTYQIWKDHLEGRSGIGIIPILDNSTCYFGAIDIDVYNNLDVKAILKEISTMGLPLLPCRSKSGGMHLYLFLKEPVPAKDMKEKLSTFAAAVGHGEAEIFPKQSEVLSERGDLGQWINMPYFNAIETDRYCYNNKEEKISAEDFLKKVSELILSEKEFYSFTINVLSTLEDGPPCLQYLITKGFTPGVRNDGLFNVAIYLKKSSPDNWTSLLDDFNDKYMAPHLTSSEVTDIVRSVKRKEYNYTCDKPPIKSYCNISLCRSRQFGVGQITGMPLLNSLTKYDSRPPIWFLDVNDDGRIELSTEELQSQQKFQKRCMESLNQMPPLVKTNIWQSILQTLLENVTLIEAPADASPKGLLFDYLERFCTSRAQANNKDELLLGKPWTDENFHYFRIIDFISYLERQRFTEFKVHKICSMFKEAGGETCFFKLKGKGVNTWKMPKFKIQNEPFNEPKMDENEVL
jgi:hypothetical protein